MNVPRTGATLFALVMAIFGCIGLAVIGFLWSQRSGDFGAPPLIFRVIGSGIGLVFVVMGFGSAFSIFSARHRIGNLVPPTGDGKPVDPAGYRCPHCGAGLGKQEVSPLGDVKCEHCRTWWNIHRGR